MVKSGNKTIGFCCCFFLFVCFFFVFRHKCAVCGGVTTADWDACNTNSYSHLF